MKPRVVRRTLRRAGRIVPATAAHLRGRSVTLRRGEIMPWHSTGTREEVVIVVDGAVRLEWRRAANRRVVTLASGQSAFLPRRTVHRLVNRSHRPARYLYVTG